MKQCYSTDEENYSHDSVDEAAQDVWDSGEHKIGDVVTIWEADAIEHKASRFVHGITDLMMERAYDAGGEYSDRWDFSKEEEESLQEAVEKAVDAWADANKKHPDFYEVHRSHPVKVCFIDEDGGCEVVPVNEKRMDAASGYAPWTPPFRYEKFGTQIVDAKGQKILDMRGWGFLTGKGFGALGLAINRAEQIQDTIGAHVAALMTRDASPEHNVRQIYGNTIGTP